MTATSDGPATDRYNEPVVDPTANVLALVEAAVKRLDDLNALRNYYEDKLRIAEAARLDANRATDIAAVNRASDVAAVTANSLRLQVEATATAFEVKLTSLITPLTQAVGELRQYQYQHQGGEKQVIEQRGVNSQTLAVISLLVTIIIVVLSYAITK